MAEYNKSKSVSHWLAASSVATLILATGFSSAHAQQANPPAEEEVEDGLNEIVITAASGRRTQINSAVSVTNVNADIIDEFQPTSEAELYRLLPGIQVAGTSGPGGNANIAVRGLPVATGGAPFVQIQEDGLPTVLFGDIQFGNNDYWTRFDASVASVEALRGGTAGTFASQAPGAVINYISRTGEFEGGYVGFSTGLGFDENQIDFRSGGALSENVRYHIGGFVRSGEGPLDAGFKTTESVQVKANITRDFEDGTGFIRAYVKVSDTKEPNYTGAPFTFGAGGNTISSAGLFPGFNGLEQFNYSALNQSMLVYENGGLSRVALDGITSKQLAVGFELDRSLSDNFSINNKFRWSDISGAFANPFLNVARTSSLLGSTLSINGTNYATVAAVRYANGPRAGQLYTGAYIDNNAIFRTNIRDLGSIANDLRLTGEFDVAAGKLTAQAGYFYMSQDIAMDWHVNRGNRELSGGNSAALDLFDASGNLLTQAGISGYNNNWGNCCARDYDLSYVNTAPYLALDLDNEKFAIDASIRFDTIDATGNARGGGSEVFIDPNGTVRGSTAADYVAGRGYITAIIANGPQEVLDYSVDYTSWTVGGLWKVNADTSLFVRASRGNRFNADRQTLSGKFNGDGSLNQAGRVAAFDEVNQLELGVKNRGEFAFGKYSIEATLLQGDFSQSTVELDGSGTRCPGGAASCVLDSEYETKGFELYGTLRSGALSVIGTATFTDAQRKGSTDRAFSRAERIPDLQYSLAANYDFLANVSGGLSVTGQTDQLNAGRVWDGGNTFNGFVRFRPFENVEFGIDAYNLFDEIMFREGGTIADTSVTPVVGQGSSVLGRTLRASLRYSF